MNGPVVALTFCRRDDTLCAAGAGGAILVCHAGRDGFLGARASLKQVQALGPSDEMVLIERNAFYKLEANVRTLIAQLEQTKAAAKQQADAAQPEFERQLGEQEEAYEAQVETLEQEVDRLTADLAHAREANAVALADARHAFDSDVKELASLDPRGNKIPELTLR